MSPAGFAVIRVLVLMLSVAATSSVPVRAEEKVGNDMPRLTLAVLPFDLGGDAKGASWAYDSFLNQILSTGRFEVVERNKLDRILQELNLGASRLADPEEAARLGRILAADLMVLASVVKGEGVTRVTARLVDTESAEIFSAHEATEPGTGAMRLQVLLGRITAEIVKDVPIREGLLIKIEDNQLFIDLGQGSGLKRHGRLLLLGGTSDRNKVIGEAKVMEVFENFLKAETVRSTRSPAVMDRVRTK